LNIFLHITAFCKNFYTLFLEVKSERRFWIPFTLPEMFLLLFLSLTAKLSFACAIFFSLKRNWTQEPHLDLA